MIHNSEWNTEQKFDDLQFELVYLVHHIELLLNPTEIVTKKYIELKNSLSEYLLKDNDDFSWTEYDKLINDLHFIEQVILKAEWKRVKEETKNGCEIDNMNEIHMKTAKDIDLNRYNELFL